MVDIKMNYHELTRVTGIPTGTNSPHGDGEALPEGEFPVDIWTCSKTRNSSMLAVLKLPNRTFHLLESSIDQNVPFFYLSSAD